MPDLLSLVIQLTADSDGTLSAESGRAAQALLLSWVGEHDAALAATLHESSAVRPYTTSGLYAEGGCGRVHAVQAGKRYWLRFTALHGSLSHLLLELAEGLPGKRLELGGVGFPVEGIASEAAAHQWAGQSSYGELVQAHFLSVPNPPRRMELLFASPTAFHRTRTLTPDPSPSTDWEREALTPDPSPKADWERGERKQMMPLPLPELFFGSLLQRWNAFAPLVLPEEVRRYAQECLAVTRYRLQTHMLRFGEALSVGFTGKCQYTALVWDPYWLRAMHLLASYAFYSGVGVRTTVGMGQAKSIESPRTSYDRPAL